jgi:Icc-related predicted phosphoesterase
LKIVCIADTHTLHKQVKVPDGDVLIVAGDFTGLGHSNEIKSFRKWVTELPHPVKVIIAGNHDLSFEKDPERARKFLMSGERNATCVRSSIAQTGKITAYLEDGLLTVDGLTIYGTPWQPRFYDWAFNLDRGSLALQQKWQQIPTGVDILVTHGPPFGILDPDRCGAHAGCELLTEELKRIKPKLHVFGHLHSGYGVVQKGETVYVNAAMCDERYEIHREPVVVDL